MKPFPVLRHFSAAEFVHPEGMDPEFLIFLDKVRTLAGIPFIVTSDARKPEENKRVGGYFESLHLWDPETDRLASAVDFATKTSRARDRHGWNADLWSIAYAVARASMSTPRSVELELVQGPKDWHVHLGLRRASDVRPSKLILALD